MSSYQIVKELKEKGQDFEWYPTSEKMLDVIKHDVNITLEKERFYLTNKSFLDIGAGNGDAIAYIAGDREKYVIEKSEHLRSLMGVDLIPVGTDFHESNLIGLNAGITFCNPPYKEYIHWATRIINESESYLIYLVIPQRWKENADIKLALNDKRASYDILWSGDFLDAERKARAKVDIVKVITNNKTPDQKKNKIERRREESSISFKNWYDKTFISEFDKKDEYTSFDDRKKEFRDSINQKAVTSGNYVNAIVEMYQQEMAKLHSSFITINELPENVFKILNLSRDQLCNVLKSEIDRLKDKYWKEFFTRYKPINSRLTSHGQEQLLLELPDNIDFTVNNCLAITVWAIKKANLLMEEQIVVLMEQFLNGSNIVAYKSNKKTFDKEEWRFLNKHWKKNHSHYGLKLDYRIVVYRSSDSIKQSFTEYNYINGLHKKAHDFLCDILTVANNIGIKIADNQESWRVEWEAGRQVSFWLDGHKEKFMEVRVYKNGNMHMKINQGFLKAFNIEFGRVNGWLKNKKEATEELKLSKEDVEKFWKSNKVFLPDYSIKLLN